MAENRVEIVLGAVVMAVAVGFVVYAGQVTGFAARPAGYPLKALFRSAEGVTVGTDVRLAGVKVGTVTALDLDLETYRASTTMTIRDDVPIPDDSAAVVASESLLGGTYVEIVPGGSPFNYAPGDEILDTQGAISLVSLLMKFVTSSAEQPAAGTGD